MLHSHLPVEPPIHPPVASTGSNNDATSIENVIRRYGKDLISNINVMLLWYFANMPTDSNRSTAITVSPSESFLLGKLDALKP
jgi:hypothetical protein